jgi:hypothetical protein
MSLTVSPSLIFRNDVQLLQVPAKPARGDGSHQARTGRRRLWPSRRHHIVIFDPKPPRQCLLCSARWPSASKSTRKNCASWCRKRIAARARRCLKRKNGRFWRAQFCIEVARSTRFERVTSTFGGWRAIHLSYGRVPICICAQHTALMISFV